MRCEICDLPLSQCPHGRPATAAKDLTRVRELMVSPNGLGHLPGCPHKGDDEDLSRWGEIDLEHAWSRLGNGEQIQATGGASPGLVAIARCRTCVEYGPW